MSISVRKLQTGGENELFYLFRRLLFREVNREDY